MRLICFKKMSEGQRCIKGPMKEGYVAVMHL